MLIQRCFLSKLKDRLNDKEYVLGDHPKNINDDLRRLLMQNQIHNVLAHNLWHTWATCKVMKRIPIDKVA